MRRHLPDSPTHVWPAMWCPHAVGARNYFKNCLDERFGEVAGRCEQQRKGAATGANVPERCQCRNVQRSSNGHSGPGNSFGEWLFECALPQLTTSSARSLACFACCRLWQMSRGQRAGQALNGKAGHACRRAGVLQRSACRLEALCCARAMVQHAHAHAVRMPRAFSRAPGCRGSAVGLHLDIWGCVRTRSL